MDKNTAEARKICYDAGLPLAAVAFVKRMLDLEARVAELDRRKTYEPPNVERR